MNDRAILDIRDRINDLDREVLKLLSQRARLAQDVGRLKKEAGRPACDRAREQELISSLTRENPGPLSEDALKHIYGEIISACRALQGVLRVSFLGPEATFSHIAAKDHFGGSAQYVPQDTIADVFREVETGRVQYGVAPVENSTEGGVGTTLDRFLQSPLRVAGEIYLKVSHALMSKETDLSRVDRVFSHPQALGQCLDWLSRRLPAGKMVATSSTSAAAARAAAEPDTAAVGGELLAELHGLNILARDIQDRSINLTRFLVIGTDDCPATGRDKTSVWFAARHKPGALYGCLKAFSDLGVNMTRIESRPSQAGQGPWEYVFFLDVEGHREDEAVRTALEELRKSADRLRVLGSYPMANPDGSEALGAAPWNLSS